MDGGKCVSNAILNKFEAVHPFLLRLNIDNMCPTYVQSHLFAEYMKIVMFDCSEFVLIIFSILLNLSFVLKAKLVLFRSLLISPFIHFLNAYLKCPIMKRTVALQPSSHVLTWLRHPRKLCILPLPLPFTKFMKIIFRIFLLNSIFFQIRSHLAETKFCGTSCGVGFSRPEMCPLSWATRSRSY